FQLVPMSEDLQEEVSGNKKVYNERTDGCQLINIKHPIFSNGRIRITSDTQNSSFAYIKKHRLAMESKFLSDQV
ncbi:MAG: hypothetical protein ACH255_20840, partial [Candidatus Thiodiazotropha sp.]